MPRILAIGNLVLDIISSVESYPQEDSEVRALGRERRAGGNAFNTLSILAQAGYSCGLVASVAAGPEGDYLADQVMAHGIDTDCLQRVGGGTGPVSCITISQATGSRSIVHHRDIPEVSLRHLEQLDFADTDWIHLEGRNIDVLDAFLDHLDGHFPHIPRSLELEKPRPGLERLSARVSTRIYSRHYANGQGYASATELLEDITGDAVCAWGDKGAWVRSKGRISRVPAFQPQQVVDSLGAGDAFNAGLILNLLKSAPLVDAVSAACELAGRAVARHGLNGLLTPADNQKKD